MTNIPLLEKEGWLRHQLKDKPPKRRRRGGQFGDIFRPGHFAELTTPSAPSSERIHLVNGASTPPFQGGEYLAQTSNIQIETLKSLWLSLFLYSKAVERLVQPALHLSFAAPSTSFT